VDEHGEIQEIHRKKEITSTQRLPIKALKRKSSN
jgi:hypothetical protein